MEVSQFVYLVVFTALLAVPVFTCTLVRKRFRGLSGIALVVIVSSVVMSSVVIIQQLSYDWYLEQQIAPLDRNGDGFWTDVEQSTWTDQDYKNMEAHIGDGGRNVFSAIVFPIFSIVYSLSAAIVLVDSRY